MSRKTLFLIQTWKDNTISYIRAVSGLTEGPDHRPLNPPKHLCHLSATETQLVRKLRLRLLLPNTLSQHKRRKLELCAHLSAQTFTSREVLITKLDEHLWIWSQNESLKLGMRKLWRVAFDIHFEPSASCLHKVCDFAHFITNKFMSSGNLTVYIMAVWLKILTGFLGAAWCCDETPQNTMAARTQKVPYVFVV